MKNTGTLRVELSGENEVTLIRSFQAPVTLVFDAFSRPELLRRWFGPRGWSLAECQVDLRVGGGFRFVLLGPAGQRMGMRGVYREIQAPYRSVHVESFDDFPGADSIVTAEFTEVDGVTTLRARVEYPNQQVRDAVIASGMEHGAAESYDKLAEMLAVPAA